jgi:Concanavalin A-like lectin/glucanases superfamily
MRQWLGGIVGTGVLATAVALLGGAGQAAAQTTAALWHMNETSGNVMIDSSGNHNKGTLHNVTLGVPGHLKTAYGFNGKTSYVSVANSPTLNPGSSNITISFWLNTVNLPKSGDYDLVRKGDFPAQEYKVELEPSGAIACTFHGSSSSHNATGGSGLNNGAWHFVQCIKTATQIQTWVDGTEVASTTATIGSITNTSGVDLGAHPGSDWYNGSLDEVSISIG